MRQRELFGFAPIALEVPTLPALWCFRQVHQILRHTIECKRSSLIGRPRSPYGAVGAHTSNERELVLGGNENGEGGQTPGRRGSNTYSIGCRASLLRYYKATGRFAVHKMVYMVNKCDAHIVVSVQYPGRRSGQQDHDPFSSC